MALRILASQLCFISPFQERSMEGRQTKSKECFRCCQSLKKFSYQGSNQLLITTNIHFGQTADTGFIFIRYLPIHDFTAQYSALLLLAILLFLEVSVSNQDVDSVRFTVCHTTVLHQKYPRCQVCLKTSYKNTK